MRNLILGLLAISLLGITGCTKDGSPDIGGNSIGGSGQGGSLARFTIVDNYLYTVDQQSLSVFDISNASTPIFKKKVNIGMDIETIFPFKNNLFIASNTGMFIYSLAQPETPNLQSRVEHFTGCDPVVANDSMAFLTIHGGNECGSNVNVLNIYDIRSIQYPQLMGTMTMAHPFGLGLKNDILYICDNGAGLRIIDVSNPFNPTKLGVLIGDAYVDVIPQGNLLIAMLKDGIAFLDISTPAAPIKLSSIKN